MQIEEKPNLTYNDIGGCKEQIEKLREVVETPLLDPERFVKLGLDPPKVKCSNSIFFKFVHKKLIDLSFNY